MSLKNGLSRPFIGPLHTPYELMSLKNGLRRPFVGPLYTPYERQSRNGLNKIRVEYFNAAVGLWGEA
jgi:hypothetical protein